MDPLRELETGLKAAVAEVRWLARVLNAADRVAGSAGVLSYIEPAAEAKPEPPADPPMPAPTTSG